MGSLVACPKGTKVGVEGLDFFWDATHSFFMPKSDHACKVSADTSYDSSLKKHVSVWKVSCSCGWEDFAESRDDARGRYRSHRDGVPYVTASKKGRSSDAVDLRTQNIKGILKARGPLRSDEVRGALLERGDEVSEPTARKTLKKLVEEGQISCKEMPSKRCKIVVLYFMSGTSFDAISSKVREFDRTPSGFMVGRSF